MGNVLWTISKSASNPLFEQPQTNYMIASWEKKRIVLLKKRDQLVIANNVCETNIGRSKCRGDQKSTTKVRRFKNDDSLFFYLFLSL